MQKTSLQLADGKVYIHNHETKLRYVIFMMIFLKGSLGVC